MHRWLPAITGVLCWVAVCHAASAQTLRMYHINVGQGDATLILGPTGTTCLVDAGPPGAGAAAVAPLMQQLGLTTLHYVVLTHYHDDHYGGIAEVINAGYAPAVAAYDRGPVNQPAGFAPFDAYVAAVGAARATITPGHVIDLGAGATLTCVGVNGVAMNGSFAMVGGAVQEENARSIALKLEYGDFDAALCGDLTGGQLGTPNVEAIIGPLLGDVDLYKVGHHGALDSNSPEFLGILAPEVSVISVGPQPFGFPTQGTLNLLLAQPTTAAVYRLRPGSGAIGGIVLNATLRVETDGTAYTCAGGTVPALVRDTDESYAPPVVMHVPGSVVVSEYMADPQKVGDATGEWVELRNTTTQPINLHGVTLRDYGVDCFVLPALTLPPMGYVVLGRNGTPGQNGGYTPNFVYPNNSFLLDDGADQIEVVSPQGVLLDAVLYDDGATFPDPAGASVERMDAIGPSTGANFAVATTPFGAGDLGTPGAPNSQDATAPIITGQPSGATLCEGGTATLVVAAAGPGPFTYQWRKDGVVLPGADQPALGVGPATLGDAGVYDVLVLNANGPRASASAVIAVHVAPTVAVPPAGAVVCEGAAWAFSVEAEGTAPLSYEWRRDGVAIPGATSATYVIGAAAAGDAADYACVVTNGCGEAVSSAATLAIALPPAVTAHPMDAAPCAGGPVALTAEASGPGPLAYQWRKDGEPIAGAHDATFAIAAAAAGDAGAYDVVVTNACGSATSAAAALVIADPVAIDVQPVSVVACAGSDVKLAVTASGTGPLAYQWRRGGIPIDGATGPTLTITAASDGDIGSYDVLVGGACGETASDPAFVDVAASAISALNPPSSAPLDPAGSIAMLVMGSCFTPASVVYLNGVAAPTTFLNAAELECVVSGSIAQAVQVGALCVNVRTGAAVSNSVPFVIGSGSNQGTIRRHPLAPAAGEAYDLVIEGGPPFAPFALLADLGAVTPQAAFPDAATDLVVAVSFVTGSAGPLLAVVDGIGLFGDPVPVALDEHGSFSLGPIGLPDPAIGLTATLQAVYLDATSPIGLRLTWARFPEQL